MRNGLGDRILIGLSATRSGARIALAAGGVFLLVWAMGCGTKPSAPPANGSQAMSAHPRSAAPDAMAMKKDQHESKVLAEALKKKPDHVPVLLRLASLAMESGKPAEAARYLREAVDKEPSNIAARIDLGKILFETGQVPEAIKTTEEILKLQPENPDALYNLGAIYGNLGQKDQAIKLWNQLISSNPDSESGKRAQKLMAELQKPSE